MIKRSLFFISLTLMMFSLPVTGLAQTFAKYGGEFLNGGVGARYLAMGNSAVTLSDDIYSIYWNPAGLTQISSLQAGFMHNERFGGLVNQDFGAFALPRGQAILGLAIYRNGIDNIADTREGWDSDRNRPKEGFQPSFFNAAEYAVYFSYASSTITRLPVGFNAKVIYRSYGDVATAYGIGFDLGTLYKDAFDISGLSLGLVAQDVTGTLISWDNGTSEWISPSFHSGLSFKYAFSFGAIVAAAGVVNRFENRRSTAQFNWGAMSHDLKGGLEYSYDDFLAIRAGYNELKRLNLGLGFKIQSLWIDYAFESFSGTESLGDSHRISFLLTMDKIFGD